MCRHHDDFFGGSKLYYNYGTNTTQNEYEEPTSNTSENTTVPVESPQTEHEPESSAAIKTEPKTEPKTEAEEFTTNRIIVAGESPVDCGCTIKKLADLQKTKESNSVSKEYDYYKKTSTQKQRQPEKLEDPEIIAKYDDVRHER